MDNVSRNNAGAMPSPCDRARIVWVDYAKGLGIVLVVFGHVWRGYRDSFMLPPALFHLVDGTIYSFHMQLFFFLAGLFVADSARRPARVFILSKLRTIVYPYVLWCFIQGAITVHFAAYANWPASPRSLLVQALTGGFGQFWFLYAMFCCLILYYGLCRLGLNKWQILLLGACLYVLSLFDIASWWGVPAATMKFFLFLSMGAFVSSYAWSAGAIKVGLVWPSFGVIGLCLALAVQIVLGLHEFSATAWLAAVTGIGMILAASQLLAASYRAKAVAWLGRASLEIYLAHILATAAVRILLARVFRTRDLTEHLILGTAAGLLFPAFLVWASRISRWNILFALVLPSRRAKTEQKAKAEHVPLVSRTSVQANAETVAQVAAGC